MKSHEYRDAKTHLKMQKKNSKICVVVANFPSLKMGGANQEGDANQKKNGCQNCENILTGPGPAFQVSCKTPIKAIIVSTQCCDFSNALDNPYEPKIFYHIQNANNRIYLNFHE